MTTRIMKIILVLLWSGIYYVRPADSLTATSCYRDRSHYLEIWIENLPQNKYSSKIHLTFNLPDYHKRNYVWKPCSYDDPPATNNSLKQIETVLKLMHLTNESDSCNDQPNKLVELVIETLSLDDFNIGRRNMLVANQSLCDGSNLKNLSIIWDSSKSIETVIGNEWFCEIKKLEVLKLLFRNKIRDIQDDAFVCLERLIEIDLSENHFSRLPERLFSRNQRLQTVKLGGNDFNSTVFSSLRSLTNVSILDLSYNKIEILSERSMSPGLKRLKRFHLQHNKLRKLYPNAFSELVELEEVDLSYNQLTELYPEMSMPRLKCFYLHHNQLRKVHRKVFSKLVRVEDIDLSSNQLTELHRETFQNNAEVRSLNVSDNALTSIPKIDHLWKLGELDLSHNNFTSIDLWKKNSSDEIEGGFTKDSSTMSGAKLKYKSRLSINLSHNHIESLIGVHLPDHVSALDVSHNLIQTVCVSSLGIRSDLYFQLRISGNPLQCNCVNGHIQYLQYPFTYIMDYSELQCELDAVKQKVPFYDHTNYLSYEDFDNLCPVEFNPSEQCVCYGIDDCSEANPFHGHCYAYINNMRTTTIHVCENLTEIPARGYFYDSLIEGIRKEYHMRFFGNNFEKLKVIQFENDRISDTCITLYLGTCNIEIIEKDAFNRLTNLEILSLSDNRIRVLPQNLFQKLTKLTELNLSYNRLTTLTGQTLIYITRLGLHNNSLTRLPLITNTNKLLLSMNNFTHLNLLDNPWSCECQFIQPFHDYLGNNADIIYHAKTINCVDERGRKYNALQFDLAKCELLHHLTSIVISTTFALIIIIISILVFIYRREVRVFVYSRYHLRIFGPKMDDDVTCKQYDAFMAYSCMDEDFLVQQLMPGLEAIPNPYRLCIHERDFPAGAFIQDSIMEAVRLSSRTIVLLSQNFVDSGWCRMEFMTAHAQMLQDRCPRVLLIVLGEIPENLDPEMELYLRTNTYLRWGERLFWEKLYYAMPGQRVTAPATDIMPMYEL